MATRTKNPVSEFIPADDTERAAQIAVGKVLSTLPEIEEYEEQPDPDEIALENVLSELGSSGADAKVNVYQIDEKKNRAFVGSFMPSDFSIEQIQAQYGAGDYAVEVRKDKKWLKKTVVKIAAPRNISAALVPQPVTGIGDAKILETMQNGFKEMGAMFANALAGLAANQPKPKTSMEMLQEMTMMKELLGIGQNSAPAAPAADPMQMVELAMNLAEKIQPRVGEPGTGEVIMEAIKGFAPLLQQGLRQQAAPVMSPPVPQNTPLPYIQTNLPQSQQQPQPAPAPENQPENDQMNIARKMYLNLLVSNAQANNDPSTYANLMLDIAGEQAALEFANAPDWFERLCAEEPRAAGLRPWFDELRMMVLELTKPDEPGISGGNDINAPAP